MPEGLTRRERLRHLRSTVRNWPLVVPDKVGLMRTVRYATRDGSTFVCRGRSPDINEVVAVMSGLEYPPRLLRVEPDAMVLDVGANIGSFSVYFDTLNRGVNYAGFAVEPFAPNIALLRRNLEANRVDRFEVVEAAIGRHNGSVRLTTDVPVDSIHITDAPTGVEVASYRLSTFCQERGIDRIDLLKLDIEGAEYDILETDYAFVRQSVRVAVIEYHRLDQHRDVGRLTEIMAPDFTIEPIHTGAAAGVVFASRRDQATSNS